MVVRLAKSPAKQRVSPMHAMGDAGLREFGLASTSPRKVSAGSRADAISPRTKLPSTAVIGYKAPGSRSASARQFADRELMRLLVSGAPKPLRPISALP